MVMERGKRPLDEMSDERNRSGREVFAILHLILATRRISWPNVLSFSALLFLTSVLPLPLPLLFSIPLPLLFFVLK